MKNILIVEDEAISALTLKMTIQKAGYNVVAIVATGEDAVREASLKNPDVILMDIRLAGEIDGIEAAAQIKQYTAVAIAFMTGYTDEAISKRALDINPAAFFTKPIDNFKILDFLKSINSIH